MRRTPFLLIGDYPGQPTGLSRILTDLHQRLVSAEDLDLDVRVCGYAPWQGLPSIGVRVMNDGGRQYLGSDWWAFADLTDWGTRAVQTAYRSFWGTRPGIVFSIWDPSRCYGFATMDLPVKKWGYFAIDAIGRSGRLTGPAGAAVAGYDRVLAYGEFGQPILQSATKQPVPWLPHGLDLAVWTPQMTEAVRTRALERLAVPEGEMVLGCVATNTGRKDLGLFAHVVAILRKEMQLPVRGWLHTNTEVSEAWSVPQLAKEFGIEDALTVTIDMDDETLAACYACCIATLAPGRGEGFGYPIAESMACGTPVAHVNHGGGVPYAYTLIDPVFYHTTGPYALLRPLLDPYATAAALAVTIQDQHEQWASVQTACRMKVSGLEWTTLWPRWQQWIAEGL